MMYTYYMTLLTSGSIGGGKRGGARGLKFPLVLKVLHRTLCLPLKFFLLAT